MPVYNYRCNKCGECQTVVAKMSDNKPEHCEQPMERVPARTGFALQGTGWYKDGYR